MSSKGLLSPFDASGKERFEGVELRRGRQMADVLPVATPPISMISKDAEPQQSILSKSWEIPPRPKPGRKPAPDTPTSKRKAQNREAQRAFRQRKAKKVDELQCQHQHDSSDQSVVIRSLQNQFAHERSELQRQIEEHRARADLVSALLREQEAYNRTLLNELEQYRRQSDGGSSSRRSAFRPSPSGEASIKPSLSRDSSVSLQRIPSLSLPLPPPNLSRLGSMKEPPTPDCSKCGADGGRCACIERILSNLPDPIPKEESIPPSKSEPYEEMEIDFTNMLGANTSSTLDDPSRSLVDEVPCGFCSDESNCVCKAAAMQAQSEARSTGVFPQIKPKPSSAMATPPESDNGSLSRRNSSLSSKPAAMEPQSCASGPGSCPSCLRNPDQQSFCRSLARVMPPPPVPAHRQKLVASAHPISDHSSTSTNSNAIQESSQLSSMTCSEAYSHLSKLPDFDKKKDSVSFMQSLQTHPRDPARGCGNCDEVANCSAFEVDCASVLAAMKDTSRPTTPR